VLLLLQLQWQGISLQASCCTTAEQTLQQGCECGGTSFTEGFDI
jgi:hypothetical protein